MSLSLYNAFLLLYGFAIRISSLWNQKARLWISGRKQFPSISRLDKPVVWMHCASLGEFEQGRPVIEHIQKAYPAYRIVVTFFSPSGYEIRKDFSGVEVFYLPMDSKKNASRFINELDPKLVLWIKYEYWYHYLTQLKSRNIPVLLISGIFRSSQPFFQWYGNFWKNMLQSFSHVFVQDHNSMELIKNSLGHKVTASGDTRFDRVIDVSENFTPLAKIEMFCNGHKVLVAGSTWAEDETHIIHFIKINPHLKFIIAPHVIDIENISELKNAIPNAMLYSEINSDKPTSSNTLIIDNIGMLSKIYKYASVAYIGGGFNASGIHNVLEAAVYGCPVIFGPVYEKFSEARGLIGRGAAFTFKNTPEFEKTLNTLFGDEEALLKTGSEAKKYVYDNKGATKIIMTYIAENRLLIN